MFLKLISINQPQLLQMYLLEVVRSCSEGNVLFLLHKRKAVLTPNKRTVSILLGHQEWGQKLENLMLVVPEN